MLAAGIKFGTVYADPPWSYSNRSTRSSADGEYPTLSVDWLCDPQNMPIAELAAERAHLHLWTTNAFIFEAKRLIDAWGFEYKSCFVWVKPTIGIGNYWRVSHEFLLLGVRGGLTFMERSKRSWGEYPRGKHSEKPDQIRNTIELVSPAPRLELFARIESPGWTCWGNQIERTLLS
jgi:N6-adenosine-specific RNA methylase IME4